ncbi:MAG: hypothetical protein QW599_05565 [Nitrososphaerota archaeon]
MGVAEGEAGAGEAFWRSVMMGIYVAFSLFFIYVVTYNLVLSLKRG